MSNKVVLTIQKHVATEAGHLPECSASDNNMNDQLVGFVLGLLSEEDAGRVMTQSLACKMCLAKLYQLRTSLHSIRSLAQAQAETDDNLEGIDLFAELERCENEDIPDIPVTGVEHSNAVGISESNALSNSTLPGTVFCPVAECEETIGADSSLNGGRKPKALVASRPF